MAPIGVYAEFAGRMLSVNIGGKADMGSNYISEQSGRDNGNTGAYHPLGEVFQQDAIENPGQSNQIRPSQNPGDTDRGGRGDNEGTGNNSRRFNNKLITMIFAMIVIVVAVIFYSLGNKSWQNAQIQSEIDNDTIHYYMTDHFEPDDDLIVLEDCSLKLYSKTSVLSKILYPFDKDDIFTVDWDDSDGWYRCSTVVYDEGDSEKRLCGYVLFDETALSKVGVIEY